MCWKDDLTFLLLQNIPHVIKFDPITLLHTIRNPGLHNYSWWRTVMPSLKDWFSKAQTVTITTIMGPNEAFWGYMLCNFHWSRWGHTRHCGAPELPGAFILVETLGKTNVSCINHHFSIYRNVKARCIQTLFMNTMAAFSPRALTGGGTFQLLLLGCSGQKSLTLSLFSDL